MLSSRQSRPAVKLKPMLHLAAKEAPHAAARPDRYQQMGQALRKYIHRVSASGMAWHVSCARRMRAALYTARFAKQLHEARVCALGCNQVGMRALRQNLLTSTDHEVRLAAIWVLRL